MEDEPIDKCGRDECKVNNGGCSDICVDTQAGFYCECRKGYKLLSDNRTCEDINECEIPGSCSQLCTNERGGFKVSSRFVLMKDKWDVITLEFIEVFKLKAMCAKKSHLSFFLRT